MKFLSIKQYYCFHLRNNVILKSIGIRGGIKNLRNAYCSHFLIVCKIKK